MEKKKRKPRGKEKVGTLSTRFTPSRQAKYCAELRATGEKALARLAVGVERACVRHHRQGTAGFKEAEEEALRLYCAENIGSEIHRRGIKGWEEPIYWQGQVVGHVIKYSDKLIIAHAKRHMPEEYGDKIAVDQTITGTLALADIKELCPESQQLLRKILALEAATIKEKDD